MNCSSVLNCLLVLPKVEEKGCAKSLCICIVHHDHFISFEIRKKVFPTLHVISCVNFPTNKGTGGLEGKVFSKKQFDLH